MRLAALCAIPLVLASVFNVSAQPGALVTKPVPLTVKQQKRVVLTSMTDNDAIKGITFRRVIGQILTSAGKADTPQAEEALVQTLLDTMSATEAVNGNVTVKLTPRPGEAALSAAALLDSNDAVNGMHATAVFPRLDEMNEDGDTCGEQRIIFAMGNASNFTRRMTWIFEAEAPNPNPAAGPAGCVDYANFWYAMGDRTPAQAAKALDNLFFKGTAIPGVGPVVDFLNYRVHGQVRGNFFVNHVPLKWELRQFRMGMDATPAHDVIFRPVPVDATPMPALFQARQPGEDPALTALRVDFQKNFIAHLPILLAPEIGHQGSHRLTDKEIIAGQGSFVPRRFNDFASVVDISSDPFANNLDPAFASDVAAAMAKFDLPYDLTVEEVFNRHASQNCAGCHQQMVGQPVAPASTFAGATVTWPASMVFVQVNEGGGLSPALKNFFLRDRLEGMVQLIHTFANTAPAPLARQANSLAQRRATLMSLNDDQVDAMRDAERAKSGYFKLFRSPD